MNISNLLLARAIEKGLCPEHQLAWDYNSVSALVDYYKVGVDWCMERNFPDYETLCRYFDSEEVRAQGVYVGQKDILLTLTDAATIMHGCTGTVNINRFGVSRLYLGPGTNIKVNVRDNAILFIDTYGDAEVDVDCDDPARCRIFLYGTKVPKENKNIKLVIKHG